MVVLGVHDGIVISGRLSFGFDVVGPSWFDQDGEGSSRKQLSLLHLTALLFWPQRDEGIVEYA